MALITLPSSPNPAGLSWRLVMPAQTNISDWTGKRQTLASGRGWWECVYSLPPIVGTEAFNPWRSFLAQMRGGANEVQIKVDPTPQAATGPALVKGASQTGRSLATDGWPVSSTTLVAGQFVTIGDQLLQLTADVVSDVSGNATISFEPPIRVAPADNAQIEYANPYALMYMTEIPAYTFEAGFVYGLRFEFREAF